MAVRVTKFAGGKTGLKNPRSINNVLTDYKRFVGLVEKDAQRIIGNALNIVKRETMPYVPKQYGGLRESARTEVYKTNKGWAGKFSFGGSEAPVKPTPNAPSGIVDYAVVVHVTIVPFLDIGAAIALPEVESYVTNSLRRLKPRVSK